MINPEQLVGWEEAIQKIARSIPVRKWVAGLTPEQRAEALREFKPDDLVHALKPEDRLVGLSEIEQLLALPPHLLRLLPEDYLATLPGDVQTTVRARRGR